MTAAAPSRSGLATAALLLGTLLFGLGRVALLPPFEGYDETGHYSYAAQLATLGTRPGRGDPMSAETERYAERAPTPPSAGRRWSYAAMAAASAEARTAARAAAASPTADPAWRAGTVANWEAQHPPLYYALLAPAFRLADRWSLAGRLFLLRGLSYGLAWAGLCCAAWAASGRGLAGNRDPGPASLALLAPALWPVVLPEWFPEMARLGNDALVALLAGATGLGLRRILAPDGPPDGPGGVASASPRGLARSRGEARRGRAAGPTPTRSAAHVGTGAAVGLGLLTKATFLPLAAAVGLVLLARSWAAPRGGRRPRLLGTALYAAAALGIAGWWYVGQFLGTGDPIGANDGINLSHGEGFWRGLRHHLSATSLLRVAYDFDLSLVWGGTWSFVVPPLPLVAPMMVAVPVLAAAGFRDRRRALTWGDAVAPSTLALFTLALVYYSLVLIAGGGLGQPAWYLHGFAPVLWPLLAWGIGAARRSRALRALLVFDVLYGAAFLAFATACDAAFYAGCAGTRGGDRYIDLPAVLSCFAEPSRLADGLGLVAWPGPALALLAGGFALLASGAALTVSALSGTASSAPTGCR